MSINIGFFLCLIFTTQSVKSQVILTADGPGNTYELINSVLAPGYNVIETPDCNHISFGRHIEEIFDSGLNKNVFRFIIHKSPDDDRCKNFDRQRNEIKTYDKSPDNLLDIEDETVVYKWKFKIDSDFQVSSSFTHLHQLKSVGGSLESMPMYTLTARKGTPDQLELRYAESSSQITLQKTELTPLKNTWLEVNEVITYGINGTYSIEIKRLSDGLSLFNYSNDSIVNWRPQAIFVRPKWGIYRSLKTVSDLRDEAVLFNDFSIEEIIPLSLKDTKFKADNIRLFPNPSKDIVIIKNINSLEYNNVFLYDSLGRKTALNNLFKNEKLDVSDLHSGLYYIVFYQSKRVIKTLKLLIK